MRLFHVVVLFGIQAALPLIFLGSSVDLVKIFFAICVSILSFFIFVRYFLKPQLNEINSFHFMIQERIAIEQQLRIELTASRNSERAKFVFLGNVSHEIRTPLTAIQGFASLAQRTITNNEKTLEYLQIIESSSQTLEHIVDDLLEFTRVESQQFEIRRQSFCVAQLLNDLEKMFRITAEKRE